VGIPGLCCNPTPNIPCRAASRFSTPLRLTTNRHLCSYMLGLVGLLLSAALPGLKPQQGEGATSASQGVFWAG